MSWLKLTLWLLNQMGKLRGKNAICQLSSSKGSSGRSIISIITGSVFMCVFSYIGLSYTDHYIPEHIKKKDIKRLRFYYIKLCDIVLPGAEDIRMT